MHMNMSVQSVVVNFPEICSGGVVLVNSGQVQVMVVRTELGKRERPLRVCLHYVIPARM